MSVVEITKAEVAQCKVRHARYLSYVKDERTTAGKTYWLTVAAEVRLQLAEALDMLYWLNKDAASSR